jgi:ABC-type branched-subunit amino acid transport system substrate-binding protein
MFRFRNVARFFFPTTRFRNLPPNQFQIASMKQFFSVILILSLCVATNSLAQKVTNDSKFRAGVDDYKAGRFAASMEKLLPLTSSSVIYSYSEYAHYYYALAAYQNKKFKESRQMLLQLQNRFPGWNKMNDVNYLLGANNLATGQWKEGLTYFEKIKDKSFEKDIQATKHHYLGTITNLASFISLQKQFPEDRDIALALVKYIDNTKGATATDRYYADQIVKQFKLGKETTAKADDKVLISPGKKDAQWTKGYYNVSVLLPFRLEEYMSSTRRSNQFAYDYYLGLLLAKTKLKSEGIDVRLWAYDVSAETGAMQAVSVDNTFQQSDLVIGPLYQGPFELAAELATKANMTILNPLSTDASLLKSSPNVYLAHPSIGFQMQKASQWMKTVSSGNTAAIYYGSTPKDSAMAFAYAAELKARAVKVLEMFKIRAEREWLEGKLSKFDAEKPAHVALFSSESNSGTHLLEVLNGRKLLSTPLIATATSFNMQQSGVGRYGSRLYLIETDYVDRNKEEVRQFQKAYWNQCNTFPSVYSYQGYDQLLFFGRMLHKYKDRLNNGLEIRRYDQDDFLLSGFDYTKGRENQIPPVLRYNGSKWEPVN